MNRPLRILVLTHRLPYAPNRGDRIRAYHLIRLLARRHQVRLVSLIHDAREASHLGEMQQLAARRTREEMLARIHGRSRVTLKTPAAVVIRKARDSA